MLASGNTPAAKRAQKMNRGALAGKEKAIERDAVREPPGFRPILAGRRSRGIAC